MARPYDEPRFPQLMIADFAPGGRCAVSLHHGGWMVVVGDPTDPDLQDAPRLVAPSPGVVDVVVHGLPGRLVDRFEGRHEIPVALVVVLLVKAGIAQGTPLRLLACHGAKVPLAGLSASQALATAWGGPVDAADGLIHLRATGIRVSLVEWDIDPVFGGMAPTLIGPGMGGWATFRP